MEDKDILKNAKLGRIGMTLFVAEVLKGKYVDINSIFDGPIEMVKKYIDKHMPDNDALKTFMLNEYIPHLKQEFEEYFDTIRTNEYKEIVLDEIVKYPEDEYEKFVITVLTRFNRNNKNRISRLLTFLTMMWGNEEDELRENNIKNNNLITYIEMLLLDQLDRYQKLPANIKYMETLKRNKEASVLLNVNSKVAALLGVSEKAAWDYFQNNKHGDVEFEDIEHLKEV